LSRASERADKLVRLSNWLIKKINKANRDFDLIDDGDRIAVAVSGGKDSLTLLELLHRRLHSVPTDYSLVPVHVVSDWRCTDQDQRAWLVQYFQSLGLEYAFPEITIMGDEGSRQREPGCFWCAWNRRKALFQTAHALQCNKVAFGHHADDIAQTTLLNRFYHGRLETMEPKVEFFGGVITVIRPLAYVPEKETARFAQAAGFPLEQATCPHALTSRRARMAQLLRQIEADCPQVKVNLFRAVRGRKAKN
jgi:tRNA 2-thiocytidine biosynthesis protein TtcA